MLADICGAKIAMRFNKFEILFSLPSSIRMYLH